MTVPLNVFKPTPRLNMDLAQGFVTMAVPHHNWSVCVYSFTEFFQNLCTWGTLDYLTVMCGTVISCLAIGYLDENLVEFVSMQTTDYLSEMYENSCNFETKLNKYQDRLEDDYIDCLKKNEGVWMFLRGIDMDSIPLQDYLDNDSELNRIDELSRLIREKLPIVRKLNKKLKDLIDAMNESD